MFGTSKLSGQILALGEVELLAPSEPTKIVALWNNFHALAAKLQQPEPAPAWTTFDAIGLWWIRSNLEWWAHQGSNLRPRFGYTCVNDIPTYDPPSRRWRRRPGAHYGLKPDTASRPKSAKSRTHAPLQ